MSKNWEERIQLRVISEMVELCGDLGDEDNQRYMSVNSAIRRVSGEDVCVERYRFHIKNQLQMLQSLLFWLSKIKVLNTLKLCTESFFMV